MSVTTRPSTTGSTRRLYFLRVGFAWIWAALLVAALSSTGSLASGETPPAFALGLLIVYPIVDVVASLWDAWTQRQRGRATDATVQTVNAGLSAVTAIVIGIAHSASGVLHVFGTWAVVSGLIQLGLALVRRRNGRPGQWPMILSGGLSGLAGFSFNLTAGQDDVSLTVLAGYATMGGVFFLISAFRQTPAPALA